MTTARPTRYEPGDGELGPSRRGGGGAGVIAASIVAAGFLLGLGVFLAILLRSPAGTGSASATPSPSAAESGAASPSPSSDEPSVAPSASGVADPLPAYIGRLPIAFHRCDSGQVAAPPSGDVAVVGFIDGLYSAAVSNRRCVVDRLVLSMHGFESREAMDAAYAAAAGVHLSHTESCEEQIHAGQGSYSFQDGRQGQAVCLLHAGGQWVMWTDEAAGVLSVIYATDTSSGTAEALLMFWRERFSLGPSS